MLTKRRKWKTTNGINVRISKTTFNILKKFTNDNRLGVSFFVDDAILEKIERDSQNKEEDVRA